MAVIFVAAQPTDLGPLPISCAYDHRYASLAGAWLGMQCAHYRSATLRKRPDALQMLERAPPVPRGLGGPARAPAQAVSCCTWPVPWLGLALR